MIARSKPYGKRFSAESLGEAILHEFLQFEELHRQYLAADTSGKGFLLLARNHAAAQQALHEAILQFCDGRQPTPAAPLATGEGCP